RRVSGAFGALAAVLVVTLGFAQVFNARSTTSAHMSPTATSAPPGTPTPLPTAVPGSPAIAGPQLNWYQGTLPVEPVTNADIFSFGVVPGNGTAAYACYGKTGPASSSITIYYTSDRAAHWSRLVQFAAPHIDLSDCTIQVDAFDASRVLVRVYGQNVLNLQDGSWNELSEDGGAKWMKLANTSLVYNLATVGGGTYALQEISQPTVTQRLVVSFDHLRTWQPVDDQVFSPMQNVWQFWLNPAGELLAQVVTVSPTSGDKPQASYALWDSTDGGAHWTLFPAPALTSVAVESSTAGAPWRICGTHLVASDPRAYDLACTFDSGHTWSARPLLCIEAPCPTVGPGVPSTFALAADDAVMTMDAAPHSNTLALYRLPRGSDQWQYLGPVSGSVAFQYATTLGGGILWAYAGGHQALPAALTTADYP
ncbi:MAG TPA: hypothetical protein VGS80_10495, partial [Ktedonobacterales bacterium]|nr:hypothetical protein [Ktedonobacterales bacterium]